LSTLEEFQRDILGRLFAATMVDGENRSPSAALHLNSVFQLPEGLVFFILKRSEGIPVKLNVAPSDFGGPRHRPVQALRWWVSERFVYVYLDLLGLLVDEFGEWD
jgi:hypothetical protein